MAAQRPDFPTLLRVDVAAEDHQSLDRFGHECRRLVDVGEGVRAWPRGFGAVAAGWIDLCLDHTRVAVVDGAKDGYGSPVAPGMADEELPSSGAFDGGFGHVPRAALWAACATVSLSAKPLILPTSVPGRL
ncbi:MAG: hypothetical protein QOE13_731 [Gaiellaceae bacterium]|nr:hypothetical protein [Gaiellaceae bacterium]